MEWHHIVEQSQVGLFGAEAIHNIRNVVRIPEDVHVRISALCSSKPALAEGLTLRQWLAGMSFEEQYQFGMDQLTTYLGY